MRRALASQLLTSVVVCVCVGWPAAAGATPITNSTIVGWTDSSLSVIVDGTSNTIVFGEQTVVSTCLDRVDSLGNITDGSSNTIVFGERVDVCFENTSGLPVTRTTRPGIGDGTSNTILLTEAGFGYFFGGPARIDLCLTNVSITDGTSNTITLPENGPLCFTDAALAPAAPPPPVPEPTLAMLLAAGAVAGLSARGGRRRGCR